MLQTKQKRRIKRRYRNEEIDDPDVGPVYRPRLFRSVRPGRQHRLRREEDRKDQEKGQEDPQERDQQDGSEAKLTSVFSIEAEPGDRPRPGRGRSEGRGIVYRNEVILIAA